MRVRLSTVLKLSAALLVALVVTAVAVVYNLDLAAYRDDIAAAVKQATGRELVVEGELRPRLGLRPAISVERVRFANAEWGSRPHMAAVERFRAEIELLPILIGQMRIRRVVLVGADILLETGPDGRGNWIMGTPAAPGAASSAPIGAVPTVHLVSIENSRLEYRDGRTGKSTRFRVDRLEARADTAESPLRIRFLGAYNDAPVTLDGVLGSLARVTSGTDALPLDFSVTAGGATLGMKGNIARPLDAKGIGIALSASGQDLAGLAPLAGRALPAIGPYRLSARLSDAERGWVAKEVSLVVGRSRLRGEATVDTTATPPAVKATLAAELLRLADFRDRTARPKPPAPAPAGNGAERRVFPGDPLPLDGLRAVDAALSLRARRIEISRAVLSDVAVELALKGGRLDVKPATLKFAGGTFAALATVDAAGSSPAVSLKMDGLGLDLATLLREAGRPGLATGKVDFAADVSGAGASVRAIMAGLDGKLQVTMNDGRIQDDLLDLASADVLKLISPFGSREKGIGVNCLVGRYDIKGGRLTSLATLFDTTRASVQATGGANLAEETLDFSLVPHAKEASVMALLVPMKVSGRFVSPSIYPDAGRIARGAVGAVTGIAAGTAGMIGSVIGGVIGDGSARPASTAANNPCVAALSGEPPDLGAPPAGTRPPPAPASAPAAPDPPTPGNPSLPEGVERTLQGIGEGLDKGLKGLFGK